MDKWGPLVDRLQQNLIMTPWLSDPAWRITRPTIQNKTVHIKLHAFLHDLSQEQFAFPALPVSSGNSGLHARIVGVKLSLNFSSQPRPITGLAVMYGLLWFARVSCPRSEWQPGGKDFSVAPLDLKGLYVTTERVGSSSERRRGGAGQFRKAERRGAVRERRLPIRQLAGGTHTKPLWLLEK